MAVLTARVLLYNVNIIFRGILPPIWEKYLTYNKSLRITPYTITECPLTTDQESGLSDTATLKDLHVYLFIY